MVSLKQFHGLTFDNDNEPFIPKLRDYTVKSVNILSSRIQLQFLPRQSCWFYWKKILAALQKERLAWAKSHLNVLELTNQISKYRRPVGEPRQFISRCQGCLRTDHTDSIKRGVKRIHPDWLTLIVICNDSTSFSDVLNMVDNIATEGTINNMSPAHNTICETRFKYSSKLL